MGYLRSLLGFEGVAPRVERIILSSLIAAISLFYAVASLTGVQPFETVLQSRIGGVIKSTVDNPATFTPSIILLVAALVTLVLSLLIINRVRHQGAVVVSTNGILHHYNQINISIRVETLQTMLMPITDLINYKELDAAFYKGGINAGKTFGVAFPLTYRERIQSGGMPDWDAVTFEQRLVHWKRYDQTSGWGDIEINQRPAEKKTVIQIYHPTLYRGVIGNSWTHFMAGYIEAFFNEISIPRGRIHLSKDATIENHGGFISLEFDRG